MNPDEEFIGGAGEDYRGEPTQGEFEQGSGVATQQLQNPNVTRAQSHVPTGPWYSQSPGVWVALAAFLFAFALIHRSHTDEYKRVRIGLENWWVVGLLAATFIYVFKTGTAAVAGVPAPIRQFFGAL